ncbi:MAG: endopeptidase La [Muribaculaceae bacterium]|nr:endopeptidase La [Muribaculaceae bacterium]
MKKKSEHIFSLNKISVDASRPEGKIEERDMLVLPTRDFVMFPGVTFSISLGRTLSIAAVERAAAKNEPIVVACQLAPDIDTPSIPDDLHPIGVAATVAKVLDLPGGTKTAIVTGFARVRLLEAGRTSVSAKVTEIDDEIPSATDKEFEAIALAVRQSTMQLLKKADEEDSDLAINLRDITDSALIINMVATHAPIESKFKQQQLLEAPNIVVRATRLLEALSEKQQVFSLLESVHERAKANMAESQKITFLQQQMEAIRQEIYGDDSDDVAQLRHRAEEANLPEYVAKAFEREVEKLSRLNPQSPDYAVQYGYLDVLLSLPWSKVDTAHPTLDDANAILQADHFGLEKVKERILEQLAVIINSGNNKSPLICLVGPPGVGKTSIGQSIARAMGRRYQRVSLGGLHDEAELRGHRRTYIGAMPGRIIEAVRKAGTSNPLLLLDEIDKLGADHKSDPSAALLEILDPEQNCNFHDNFVDIDFDLSKVLFIATANTLQGLSRPLLDRMEVIEVSGYILQEKLEIAARYLVPKQLKAAGFKETDITFTPQALQAIIEGYTAESGVRGLEKQIASVIRKILVRKLMGQRVIRTVNPRHVTTLLGKPTHLQQDIDNLPMPGVATGLAWTAVGGETLSIETSISKAKTPALTLTGQLGDVMKESATIALQYVRANIDRYGGDPEIFDTHSVHIHVPEGAIPKDGPSAGITLATSILSAVTGRRVRGCVAMTGEITLRGRVLAVGGIKEKILAAKRKGVSELILPAPNRRDIDEIPAQYLEGLTFHYVDTADKVFDIALEKK